MIGQQVLQYRIVEKLGEGGMGVVYRAEDTKLHRDVALKFLPDEALEREADRERFIAEARAAAALDHPNICTVHDIHETEGHYFIAMAFVEGRDVKETIEEDGPLPVLDAVKIAAQVADGLAVAHEKGVVHRDIKSANVMITPRGRAMIMDFGLAQRPLEDRAAMDSTTGGTIAYASPEQAAGRRVDHRTDVWSAGVMLYEMLTGTLPFGGDYESAIIYSILNEPAPAPSSLRAEVPEALDRIVARALAKDPDDRYRHIDEMRDELVQVRHAIDPTVSRAGGVARVAEAPRNPWRRVALWGALWLAAAWALTQAVGLVVGNLQLSPHVVPMVSMGLLALLPAVGVVAWSTTRRGSRRWGRAESIGVPVNVVLAGVLLYVVFAGKDLGAAMQKVAVTDEEGQTVERVIPKGSFRKNFALYAFENKSGDADLDWLEYAMPTLLELDLYQDAFVTVRSAMDGSSWERLQQAGFKRWNDAPLALKREIAGEFHDKQFVTASIDRKGGEYVIDVQVHDTDSGRVVDEQSYHGRDIFALADEIAVDLKHAVGVPAWHLDGAPDLPVADMVTDSQEALREYVTALEAMVFDEDWTAAHDHLDAATAADSTMAFAYFHKFMACQLTNDYPGAVQALQDALRHVYKVPERFRFVIKGNYYFLKQEPDKALALFEMMTELYPDDIQGFQALARIHTLRGETDEAIASYERVVELDPYQYDHFHQLATLCARKGYYDRAMTYAKRYAELNPEDPKSFEELSDLNQQMGRFKEAKKNIDKALLFDPERVTLLIGAGNIARAQGRFDNAVARYAEAMRNARSSMDSSRVLVALEQYYELRGRYSDAIGVLDRRLALDTTPINRYAQRLGNLHLYVYAGRAADVPAIMKNTRRVFDTPPISYVVSYGDVRFYGALGQPDSLERAIDGFEKYIQAFHYEVLRQEMDLARARVLELRGDYDGAAATCARVTRDHPGSRDAWLGLGRCYRELGRRDDAVDALTRAVTLSPSDARVHYQLALVYHDAGDMKKAREHLDQALATWSDADSSYRDAREARETRDAWDSAAGL